MSRPLRFVPPDIGSQVLARTHLLRRLQQRWTRRVTLVVAGAGFGKTTLLAQMLAENRLSPRGRDVWLGLQPADADAGFGTDLLAAIDAPAGSHPGTAVAIADACWQLAPTPVCLVVDDAHVLPSGSVGQQLLVDLVAALPANGHLLVAARTDPGLPTARLDATGEVLRLTETDLTLDDEEIRALARRRGLAAEVLAATGGWPAMVELVATAGKALASEFVWQEVIQPLPPQRRRVLAAVVELGGGDDALVSAALEDDVHLAEALAGVPLIATSDDGWHRPHQLWQPMARLRLADRERALVVRRAVQHLNERGRFDDAFDVVARAEAWEELPALFRASCVELTRHPPAPALRRWLAAVPPDVGSSPAAALASGVLASLEDPDHAGPALRAAVEGFRKAGDVDGELGAITHLGRVAWWTGHLGTLAELAPRVTELAATGHPAAVALDAVGRAIRADLDGDDAAMLAALAPVQPGQLGSAWEPALAWMRAIAHYDLGDLATARAITTAALEALEEVTFRDVLEALHASIAWQLGLDLDAPLDESWLVELGARAALGIRHNVTVAAANMSLWRSHLGDLASARALLDHARGDPAGDRPVAVVRLATAEASLALAEGDEDRAADALREALAGHALTGPARRAWRDTMCLTYVLLPDVRGLWDEHLLHGVWARRRDYAATVVAVRQGDTVQDPLSRLPLDDVGALRAHLHHRFAAELAVSAHAAGRAEASDVLEALGRAGRARVRELSGIPGRGLGSKAKELLGTLPAMPSQALRIAVLGPLALRHGDVPSNHPALRRERVRALLAYLILTTSVTRAEIVEALWPDLDEQAGKNNLRVTLNHLLRVLDPGRTEAEPSYFVRIAGPQVRLVRNELLHIDVDDLHDHLAAADHAERDGVPSVALDHHLAAIDLWNGELCVDVNDAHWLDLERERARTSYLRALRRAGQLLLAQGALDHAYQTAQRAIRLDPWAEDAHGVLIGVALARNDRTAARRALARARDALAEISAEPGHELRRLALLCE